MRALVVYESMFGNTQSVAKAIADGLAGQLDVELVEVGVAPAVVPPHVGLVVAGGPTHAFGLSRASTRQSAAAEAAGPLVSEGIGLREWLDALPRPASDEVRAATFDTRVRKPHVPGSAAHAAERRLRKLGFRIAAHAETFWVEGTPGPLHAGELNRAREWGEQLAGALVTVSR